MSSYIFTSESVTEGHPDKMADQISDSVLDAIIADDPKARVACETLVTTGLVLVAGEITTSTYVDIQKLARDTIKHIGYNDATYGFDYKACSVLTAIDEQSPDIAMGVDRQSGELGAGDQGMMFGYACNETPELMPLPISLAHKLTKKLAELRKNGTIPFLRPDGKAQVSVEYVDGKPVRLNNVVVSTQHNPDVSQQEVIDSVIELVIKPVCDQWLDDKTVFHVNPTGQFIIGGPPADAGLTGRKIIVDTYGGMGRHGGGCFSGKDPSKVDRSATYAVRHIAKNIVAAKLAKECLVQVAYAIGVAEPVSIFVETKGTGVISDSDLAKMIRKEVDLTPKSIINRLGLKAPIYQKTSSYGHFGRNEFSWEKLDLVEKFKKYKKG